MTFDCHNKDLLKNLEQGLNFQSVIRPDFPTKKPLFKRL
jgi:hypothetical protein